MNTLSLGSLDISSLVVQVNTKGAILFINPGVHCIFDHAFPTNSYHMHNCYELCIVTSGKGFYKYNDQIHTIEKGDLFLADPEILHEIAVPLQDKSRLEIFYFSFEILKTSKDRYVTQNDTLLDGFLYQHQQIAKKQDQLLIMLECMRQYTEQPYSSQFTIKRLIESLILESIEILTTQHINFKGAEVPTLGIIDEALTYISKHLTEKIKIEDIAQHTNTSVRNLQRLFKRSLNITVKEYIDRRRINFAASYLRMNFKVSDVALRIGIEDSSQFGRFFKKYMGMTPKQYQMKYISDGMKYGALFEDMP